MSPTSTPMFHSTKHCSLSQTLRTNFPKVGAIEKIASVNKGNKDVASDSYSHHTAPTFPEVGAIEKLQGCNFSINTPHTLVF